MSIWNAVLWILIIASALPALYALHQLALWLEKRGWLFYKRVDRCADQRTIPTLGLPQPRFGTSGLATLIANQHVAARK